MTAKLTDNQLVLLYLWDMEWHNAAQVMAEVKPGCYGWALRSRVSNLKKMGWDIEARLGGNGMAEYRLKSRQQRPMLVLASD